MTFEWSGRRERKERQQMKDGPHFNDDTSLEIRNDHWHNILKLFDLHDSKAYVHRNTISTRKSYTMVLKIIKLKDKEKYFSHFYLSYNNGEILYGSHICVIIHTMKILWGTNFELTGVHAKNKIWFGHMWTWIISWPKSTRHSQTTSLKTHQVHLPIRNYNLANQQETVAHIVTIITKEKKNHRQNNFNKAKLSLISTTLNQKISPIKDNLPRKRPFASLHKTLWRKQSYILSRTKSPKSDTGRL